MPRAERKALALATLLALGAAAQPATPAPAPPAVTPPAATLGAPQPIDIQADFGELDRGAGRGLYRGNVVIQQGSMRITAAEVRIVLVDDELARVEIDGAPATFEQVPEGATQPTRGMARSMVYEVKAATVELKGEARIEQRGDAFAGESIRYDLTRDRVLAAGGQAEGERVQVTITPRRAKAPEAPPPTKPTGGD